MANVYFVRMPEMRDGIYPGYVDYFRLAELSGYPVIYLEDMQPESDNTYILTPLNGNWMAGWQNPKARIIWHDLEWRVKDSGYQWTAAELATPPGVSEVWASDKWYANVIGAKYVPLGSHPGLVEREPAGAAHDVAFMAYMGPGRRNHIAALLEAEGLTVAPSVWNPERDALLKTSACMVHVHQWDNVSTVAPLRFAIAAAYGLPLISEQVQDRDIFENVVLFSDYAALPAYVTTLVRRYGADLQERGAALKELLTGEYSFRKCVEAAL